MERTLWIGLCGLLCFSLVSAVPYSKYGRSCKDIGCRSNEVCVMAEDPCTIYSRNQCGRYPTCTKSGDGGLSCTTMICPSGQYCKTIDGQPTCVNTSPNLEYDSAGVSSVNGQRTNTDGQSHGTSTSNINPYANANAPPPEPHHDTNYRPVNSPTNNGYPPYPSGNGNSGYPPYPSSGSSSGTNLGYPPYPTQNRMPQPNVYQPGHYPGNLYPAYPSNQQPGYQYPNYPYQSHSYNTNSRRFRGAAVSNGPKSWTLFISLALLIINKYLS